MRLNLEAITFLRGLVALGVGLSCVGCTSTSVKHSRNTTHWSDLQAVAACGATDKATQDRVKSILAPHNLDVFMEGSVVYTIYVRKIDYQAARELLADDTRLKGRWFFLIEATQENASSEKQPEP
jgi:hypothetical protein